MMANLWILFADELNKKMLTKLSFFGLNKKYRKITTRETK
jgi:hypothetical protein